MVNIFYGAGSYAKANLQRLLDAGIAEPACFADANEEKHNHFIFNGAAAYPIMSLEKAIAAYPDYLLYLTVGKENLLSAWQMLIGKGVAKNRIRFVEDVIIRRGCSFLGEAMKLYGEYWMVCHFPCGEKIASSGSFADDYQRYKDYCTDIISRLESGKPTACDDCYNLREDIFPVQDIQPKMIVFATGFDGDRCNFKCVHCYVEKNFGSIPNYRGERFVDALESLGRVVTHKELTVYIANGEPTARDDFDSVIEHLRGNNWKIMIATNCSIYREKLTELIRSGHNIVLNVSPDCGTRETFAQIKSIDCYDKFLANLDRYASAGGEQFLLQLKYVLIPGINDNELDADGFVELARKYKAIVILSNDINHILEPLPKNSQNILMRIIQSAKRYGLFVAYARENFHVVDSKIIQNALSQ